MKFSSQIKPISYLKANAAKVVEGLAESGEPMVITQNGEAKAVIQDVKSYEQTQETLALLKILALGNRQAEEGRVHAAKDAITSLRKKYVGGCPSALSSRTTPRATRLKSAVTSRTTCPRKGHTLDRKKSR